MLDLVSNGRVEFGTGESSSRGRARRLHDRPDRQARDVAGGPRGRGALHDRDAVHRALDGKYVHDAAAQRRAQAACRSRTRRCGSRAAAATRSTSPPRRASARSTFAFIDPEEATHWVDDYYDDARRARACRSATRSTRNVACVTHVHVPPTTRTRRIAPRHRGRELLRLLARALLRVRRAPARRDRRVGRVPASAAPSRATTPRRWPRPRRTRTGSAPRSSSRATRRAARRGRHARPDPRVPRAATRSAASTR